MNNFGVLSKGHLIGEALSFLYLHGNDRLEVLVQLVHERDARGEVEAHDGLVRHLVQVLHDPAEGVAVRRDQDTLASLHLKHINVLKSCLSVCVCIRTSIKETSANRLELSAEAVSIFLYN